MPAWIDNLHIQYCIEGSLLLVQRLSGDDVGLEAFPFLGKPLVYKGSNRDFRSTAARTFTLRPACLMSSLSPVVAKFRPVTLSRFSDPSQ